MKSTRHAPGPSRPPQAPRRRPPLPLWAARLGLIILTASSYVSAGSSTSPAHRTDSRSSARRRLTDVQDYTISLEGHGLYLLLEKADKLDPQLLLEQALPVRREFLIDEPDLYRGRLVKLPIQVAEIRRVQPADRLRWPRPAWAVTGLDPRSHGEPVTVLLVAEPAPVQTLSRVWAVGYFLKLRIDRRRRPDAETGQTQVTLPVLVGKTLPALAAPDQSFRQALTVAALALLVAAYFVLRRLGRGDRSVARSRYRPLRYEPDMQTQPEQLDMIRDKDPAEALDILAGRPPSPDDQSQQGKTDA